jgi:hypothetical protein
MSLSLALYFVDILANFRFLLVALTVSSFMTAFGCFLFAIEAKESDKPNYAKLRKIALGLALVFATIVAFIPDTKTLYAIIGVEAAKMVVTSPEGKQVTDKVMEVINKELDAVLGKHTKKD